MSTPPENELDLDKLFLPAWAQEPASKNVYERYEGHDRPERSERRGGGGGSRGPGDRARRDGPPRRGPGAPGQGFGQGRPAGPPRGREGAPGGRPPGGGENRGSNRRQPGGPRGDRRFDRNRESRPTPPPLPEIALTLLADERGVDSLARQIRMTGRAYPLFDIAQMILQRPERLSAVFSVKKNAEGKPIQPLFVCALDDTLWLSEDEAVAHVLQKHFGTFYQAERTATEPPKGKYTFVAQCGMSGAVLGPPNYHDYQNQLRKLHAERFSRMPFEEYKSRVRIVRDEEVVKKWVEDQSWKTEYVCLNLPEPVRLANMEAVEKHFRETHKENIIKPVESHTLNGSAARSLRSTELVRLVRNVWDDQKRFPLQIATALSQQFASRGLQFFKVNRTITHVSVARPHYLDLEATPVSEGVKKIVEFINTHPKCTRRRLVEALAPSPARPVAPEPTPTAPAAEPVENPASGAADPASTETAAEPAAPALPEPSEEQTAVVSDLHWLIHQGHVIEFANGVLETAKKPAPRPPPKPARTEKTPEAAAAAGTDPNAESSEVPTAPGEGEATQEPANSNSGSMEKPSAGIGAEIVRPGENPAANEASAQESDVANPPSESADLKVESPS